MNAEPEKKGFQSPPKKTLMIGGAAVVVVIAAVAAFSMFSGGGSGADYALYLKDDQLVYTTLKEEGDWDVTSDLADGEEVTASDAFELSLLVTMSEDGKRIFFPDRGGDAIYYRDEMRQLFSAGRVSLRERTLAERFFWAIIMKIAEEKRKLKNVPRDLQDIDVSLADIYYGNFSVFQSLPDSWAIDQVFPIMPIHRLHEFPSRQGIISDITCDSDGRIDQFIDPQGMKPTLDLHPLREGEEYYLGVFLVGAYQETLGDLHNLLGDTNVVSIRTDADGSFEYVREIRGDSVGDILGYVEYEPRRIVEDLRSTAEQAVRSGRITASERFSVLQAFEDGLRGYTYFER